MKYKRIFLIGFRATGKSTLGKILAKKLGFSFFDMDFLITQLAGQEVDVLTKNGTDWLYFRKIENEVLDEISKMENIVVSCGGGVGVNDILDVKIGKTFGELNTEILKSCEDCLVILLTSDEKTIRERLKKLYRNKKIMPFLNEKEAKVFQGADENKLIDIQVEDSIEAFRKRKPLYEDLGKIKINTRDLSQNQVVEKIIGLIKI